MIHYYTCGPKLYRPIWLWAEIDMGRNCYGPKCPVTTEHHLEFLSLNEAAEARPSLHMLKWPHSWKSHATAHILIAFTEPVYHPKNNTES